MKYPRLPGTDVGYTMCHSHVNGGPPNDGGLKEMAGIIGCRQALGLAASHQHLRG